MDHYFFVFTCYVMGGGRTLIYTVDKNISRMVFDIIIMYIYYKEILGNLYIVACHIETYKFIYLPF